MKFKKMRSNALTPLISALLSIAIVFAAIGSIIIWGLPYMNSQTTEELQERAYSQLTNLNEAIHRMSYEKPGEKSATAINLENSKLYGMEDTGRMVIATTVKDNYSYKISGLDSPESSNFTINMTKGKVTRAEAYWLKDDMINVGTPCFLAGTKVLMADGSYKNIENIKSGDKVLSFDEKNNELVVGKVSMFFEHSPSEMGEYYLLLNNILAVTPGQLFYVENKGWVPANKIKVGDILFGLKSSCKVFSIEKIFDKKPTYDFIVDKYHNYFVRIGSYNVLVHNTDSSQSKYPSKGGQAGYDQWDSAKNAFDNDGQNAVGINYINRQSEDYEMFGFNIPDGSSITGIMVEVKGAKDSRSNPTLQVKLSWNSGESWTDYKQNTWTKNDYEIKTFGGNGDTWGRNWSPSDFSDKYFYVLCTVTGEKANDGAVLLVDYINVTVYYTSAGNNPPSCTLTASPTSGDAPLEVTFYMSASDSDGKVTGWSLDVDNDGSPEFSGIGEPPSSRSYTYTSPGSYTANLTVVDDDNAKSWDHALISVFAPAPELAYSPKSHDFGAVLKGSQLSTSFSIWNSGSGTLLFNLTSYYDWINVEPVKGSSTGNEVSIRVTVNTSRLSVGEYTGYIYISSNGGSGSFTVNVTVVSTYITVLKPRAGDSYRVGNNMTITWTNLSINGNLVNISLYNASGKIWDIAKNVDIGDHSYTWNIPLDLIQAGTHSKRVFINISHNKTCYDLSPDFYILERFDGIYYNETLNVSSISSNNYTIKSDDSSAFNGTVVIELYNGSIIFGRIWIFDTDSLVYEINSDNGNYKVVSEFGGIIHVYPSGDSYVRSGMRIENSSNAFSLFVPRLKISSHLVASGSWNYKVMSSVGVISERERVKIYSINIYMFGIYNKSWKRYFAQNFGSTDSSNLVYSYSDKDGKWLALLQSTVKFSVGI